MAHLLGSKFCIESLRNDVSDLQSAVVDVTSRVGPVKLPSWKYPDKQSCDLDIDDILETYDYSDDEEDRQVAHIVLLEMVIDRMVLLYQAMSRFADQSLAANRPTTAKPPGSNMSIGLVVKKYWNKTVQMQTLITQLKSENKSKNRQISNLEATIAELKQTQTNNTIGGTKAPLSAAQLLINSNSTASTGSNTSLNSTPKGSVFDISNDAYHKCSQTVETAFVPCESCDKVQKCLNESAVVIEQVCNSQGLPSSLRKFRQTQIPDFDWLTANDVTRWTKEQNKDLNRINKHLDHLLSTIEPLKKDLSKNIESRKKLEQKVANFDHELELEKESQSAQMKQHKTRLVQIEKDNTEALNLLNREKTEIWREKSELEGQLDDYKNQLQQKETELQSIEEEKVLLQRELDESSVNSGQVKELNSAISAMQTKLHEINGTLEQTQNDLLREKAKYQSAAKQNQSLQAKQDSLFQRMNDIDAENDELRNQVADLEDEKEMLEKSIKQAKQEKITLEKSCSNQQVQNKEHDSAELEDTIDELRSTIRNLEDKLTAAKDRERLILEYPDLNGPVNPDTQGTGDIAKDMENQVRANAERISLLESQNNGLRKTISKMIHSNNVREVPQSTKPQSSDAPVPLWRTDAFESPPKQQENYRSRNVDPVGTARNLETRQSKPHSGATYTHRTYSPASSDDGLQKSGLPPRPPSKSSNHRDRGNIQSTIQRDLNKSANINRDVNFQNDSYQRDPNVYRESNSNMPRDHHSRQGSNHSELNSTHNINSRMITPNDKTNQDPGLGTKMTTFVIGQGSRPNSAKSSKSGKGQRSRPSSVGASMKVGNMNASSISAYLQLKRSGALKGLNDKVKSRPPSGPSGAKSASPGEQGDLNLQGDYTPQDTYVCEHCDKMYTTSMDLDLHKSYCSAM
ncbi:unnamed protein product [Owenia fusiformis]|uniref:Coiled-coil domain-containing protein 157 n=1 Tax=Owenia fusiformis TaxID=6347 RepID=A0A8S4QA53_OWEFU|nr:unnamed protein product [Owenia fusiformis]